MSLKNNQTFPGVRGLACQEWLRSRKLSTCPLTPSSILRQSLGPWRQERTWEGAQWIGPRRGSWHSSGAPAQVGLWILTLFSPGSCFAWADYPWGRVAC